MKNIFISICALLLLFSFAQAQTPLITIDAQKDAFYDALTSPDNGKVYMPSRCYLSDVNANPPAGGDADCSGIVWACWEYPEASPGYLYYYVEVKDDTVIVNNSAASGSKWSNDKFEIKFDPDPTQPDGSGLVMQVGISSLGWPNLDEDGVYAEDSVAVDNLHQDNELQLADGTKWVPTPDDYARRLTDDGYVLEFRIPLDYINKGTRSLPLEALGSGTPFGTAMNIADNDSVARTDMLQWSAGHADQAWSYPRHQGTITFLDNHIVKFEAVSPNTPTLVNDSAQAWYFGGATSVKSNGVSNTPAAFSLMQNYPNPFNPSTIIRYQLDKSDRVSMIIYNTIGAEVRHLLSDQMQSAGSHEVVWNAKDDQGALVSSGVYFYRIKTGTAIETKKMLLIR